MSDMKAIKSIADIRAVESAGYDVFCPYASPQKIVEASAARWPDKIALHYLADANDASKDRRWTYSDLWNDVVSAARVFRKHGIVPGKSVAILANHTPAAQIALWGAQIAGRAVLINPLLRPAHIASLLSSAEVGIVVMMGVNDEHDYWTGLVPALRELGVDLPIFDCDSDGPSIGSSGSFESLIRTERGRPLGFEIEGSDDTVAALYHTGGTTGAPKLVQHTRRNEAHVARSCALLHGYTPDDIVVNGFPLFHVAGAFVYGLSALSQGSTILIPGRLGMRNSEFIRSFWKQAERHGITIIAAVPTILSGLMNISVDADTSKIRAALTGGSPLPTELATAFEARVGVPVRNIFGMTESAGSIALESVNAPRTPLCCGYPLPFSEVVVLENRPSGASLAYRMPAGEAGIVAVRGPNISPGYTDSERNAGTFLEDGWLLTGDLGYLDVEGKLYLTGRAKDVIIRGSHNIDPQSIEGALLAHPDVESAAAVGMPDSYSGELPILFATLRKGATVNVPALMDFLKSAVEEPAAMPKRLEIIDEMPLTPVGKIFKPALRRKAILWAIEAAAAKSELPPDAFTIRIDETLEVEVEGNAEDFDVLKSATMGMPIVMNFKKKGG